MPRLPTLAALGLITALLLAACAGAAAPDAPGAGTAAPPVATADPGDPAGTEEPCGTPEPGAADDPGATGEPCLPAGPGATDDPDSPPAEGLGSWTVTLSGGKPGAGTYSATEPVECFTDGSGHWDASGQLDVNRDVRIVSVSSGKFGDAGIEVSTRWSVDTPVDWGWFEGLARVGTPGSITVTGDDSSEPWTVRAEASWHDGQYDTDVSVVAELVCSVMERIEY